MRNTLKAATLESKFPLLAVEADCIISKDADITAVFEVELPELFTVTAAEYEAIHAAWAKAIKVLPNYTVVHKQDWFIREDYRSQTDKENLSFLSRSYELHFNERPFLNHKCYLYLTKTTKERMRMQSNFSSLCRGFIIPKEVDKDTTAYFLDTVGQFARIVNDTGLVRLRRLGGDEITGTEDKAGLVEKYFCLSMADTTTLEDIELGDDGLRVGDKHVSVHTLSELDALPNKVGTDCRYERLSTDKSDCKLSFASPVGLLLSCNHLYNQYVFLDDSGENLQRFEKSARNMQSLSKYSRSNQINKEWIDLYLNDAHSFGLTSVRAHCNIIAWTDNPMEVKNMRNDVGSQIAMMECKPRHNTVDAATLYWAAMPGNGADFPAEESFYTFIEQALCFWVEETNYRSSVSPFGLKMSDRISGKPLHVDISDLPMKRGITTKGPGAVHPQMDVERQVVVEDQEEMLAMRICLHGPCAVHERRALREPTLGTRRPQALPHEGVLEPARHTMDRMSLRHRTTALGRTCQSSGRPSQSSVSRCLPSMRPVASNSSICPMRRT